MNADAKTRVNTPSEASTRTREAGAEEVGDVGAVECRVCAAVLWPPQQYGCERCGAHGDSLRGVNLPARGRLASFATVHSHPTLPTPFTVIEVVLDAGPLFRSLLRGDEPPPVGARMIAVGTGVAGRLAFDTEPGT